MFIEKKWLRVPPKAFTADGTAIGVITVPSVAGFYVKQFVTIKGNALQTIRLQIKRVLSDTEIAVGPVGKITDRSDISAYTVALSSTVEAEEQDRNDISLADRERAVYAEEPIVAIRTALVDDTGDYYSANNPIPVASSGDNWDEINIVRDSDGDMVTATYSLASVQQKQYNLTYDTNKDLKKVTKT